MINELWNRCEPEIGMKVVLVENHCKECGLNVDSGLITCTGVVTSIDHRSCWSKISHREGSPIVRASFDILHVDFGGSDLLGCKNCFAPERWSLGQKLIVTKECRRCGGNAKDSIVQVERLREFSYQTKILVGCSRDGEYYYINDKKWVVCHVCAEPYDEAATKSTEKTGNGSMIIFDPIVVSVRTDL